jgi:hypothetical protein
MWVYPKIMKNLSSRRSLPVWMTGSNTADRIDSFSAGEAIALALPLIIPANCHDLKANLRRLKIVSIVAVATRSISAVVLVCPIPKRNAA